jgi:hypothetical protein
MTRCSICLSVPLSLWLAALSICCLYVPSICFSVFLGSTILKIFNKFTSESFHFKITNFYDSKIFLIWKKTF